VTAEAVALTLVHLGFLRPDGVADLTRVIERLPEPRQPWCRVARAMFVDVETSADRRAAVLRLTDDPDPRTVAMAWQWAAILAENEGLHEESRGYLDRALSLVGEHTTVWEVATLHTQRAMHALNQGEHEQAARHARAAIPLLERLHDTDDAYSMRTSVALSALQQGRTDEAERLLADAGEAPATDMTAALVKHQLEAELRFVRGDVGGGLDRLERSLAAMREISYAGLTTNGLEPWTLIPLATALAAFSRYADSDARRSRARTLASEALTQLLEMRTVPDPAIDYPVTGMGLAALGAWLLTEQPSASDVESGVRLLALADGFGYNR
jgi:tetratricopeptide (TPR) repeat protein